MSAANDQIPRLEHLLAMGKRLAAAIEGDITALERGAFQDLRSTDPEISKLAALYAREVAAVKAAGGIGEAPAALLDALKETSVRLKAGLLRHDRLVMCMRQASEGLVQAVAEEVEKTRKQAVPYSPKQVPKGVSTGAMVYNKIV